MSEVAERKATIAVEHPDQPEIRALIEALNAYLLSLYRPEDCYHLTIQELCRPDVTFFVARQDGAAVGCGALRRLGDGMGEVKRMFTLPAARGAAGIGRRILHAIEAEGRRSGCDRLVLETGANQPEALALYRSAGFYECGAYGEYRENGASVFMEKPLSTAPGRVTDLTSLTIAEIRDRLARREFSALELTDAYLAAIAAANPLLNAYIVTTPEKARAMARDSDARIARGEARALEGVPIGVKDLFCTKGVHTQAASHILDGFKPTYESTVTANLWADGAVMLGKLNMDEFAMGSSNETSYYGPVVNPWRRRGGNADLVPGGSSGGSASAVAARLCAGATATDTGGSIRQPAAFTGTVGIKPTYGRCSRWGIVAFASSLDQAGPIARSVRDAAILLESMASPDPKDTTSADLDVPHYESAVGESVKGLKVGVPREYRMDGMPAEIDEFWQRGVEWYRAAGAEIVNISLPHTKYALPAYYIVAPAEASSNLARYDGVRYGLRVPGDDIVAMYENTRGEGFGREVKRRVLIGTYVLSAGYYDAYYVRAQKVRTLIKRDFEQAFAAGIDVILTPATPSSAFGIGEKGGDPVEMYLNDIFAVTVNMAGLPGIAVPAGLDASGLPMALQLIGRPFDEATLFRAGQVIEDAAGRFSPQRWW